MHLFMRVQRYNTAVKIPAGEAKQKVKVGGETKDRCDRWEI